jgi:long-chain acyl-CoA synthetase
MVLFLGAAVGYYSGDTRKVLDDAKELRPTVFAGVPRVYERVYSGVLDKVRAAALWQQQQQHRPPQQQQ